MLTLMGLLVVEGLDMFGQGTITASGRMILSGEW